MEAPSLEGRVVRGLLVGTEWAGMQPEAEAWGGQGLLATQDARAEQVSPTMASNTAVAAEGGL